MSVSVTEDRIIVRLHSSGRGWPSPIGLIVVYSSIITTDAQATRQVFHSVDQSHRPCCLIQSSHR